MSQDFGCRIIRDDMSDEEADNMLRVDDKQHEWFINELKKRKELKKIKRE